MSSSVISDIQSINPSSIIELFTLTTTAALHGSDTTYRFHAGSSLMLMVKLFGQEILIKDFQYR